MQHTKIKSIRPAGYEPVYNMTVDEYHNYVIKGGIVLKNCDALRYFAVSRILLKEEDIKKKEAAFEDEGRIEEDYDTFMTGGVADRSYLGV